MVLQTLQVGFRPRGIVAGSGGPRGRSDTGMATADPGRPRAGPPRPATGRTAGARAPSCPRWNQAAAAPRWRQEADSSRGEPSASPGHSRLQEARPRRGLPREGHRAAALRRLPEMGGARRAGDLPDRKCPTGSARSCLLRATF